MSALAVRVPAKINLHLQVLGRRADGYHELRTLLQSVDLFDEVRAETAEPGVLVLEVDPAGAVGVGEDNLVLRAAASLALAAPPRAGASIRLRKRIPVGAGLGGGSADAAATLVLLDRLWELGLGADALHRLAAGLGSDVPFFLVGGLALGVGRGEEIYPLPDLDPMAVVVITPEVEVATARVYGELGARLTWDPPDGSVYAFAAGLGRELPWGDLSNDLQPAVTAVWPGMTEVVDSLWRCRPVHAAVTGSGSAAFGVFADRTEAAAAAAELGRRWPVHEGVTVPRSGAELTVRRV